MLPKMIKTISSWAIIQAPVIIAAIQATQSNQRAINLRLWSARQPVNIIYKVNTPMLNKKELGLSEHMTNAAMTASNIKPK